MRVGEAEFPAVLQRSEDRGDPASREFISFWLKGGRVLAAMNANVWDAGEAIEGLVSARAAVEPARLTDPDVDLGSLVPGS